MSKEKTKIIITSILLFLVFFAFYSTVIVRLDNTNLTTTNGLWKSTMIRGWEVGTGKDIERGGFLYAPVYGKIASLIPDSLLQYGTPAEFVTYRKMAFINAMFGALSSVIIFLIGYFFIKSFLPSIAIALFHSVCGFVFLCSVNSEDVMPAYFFFLAALLCFFRNTEALIHNPKNELSVYFYLSCFFAAMVPFFHWTLMPPMLFGFLVALLYLRKEQFITSHYIIKTMLGFWAVIFVVFYVSTFLTDGALGSTFTKVVFSPKKGMVDGWLGFRTEKVFFLLSGLSNYVIGGNNVGSIQWSEVFSFQYILGTLTTIASVCISILTAILSTNVFMRVFCLTSISIFVSGQAIHFYSQPQDPQSQIQPMIVIVFTLMILTALISKKMISKIISFALFLVLAITVLIYNLQNFITQTNNNGTDSYYVGAVNTLNKQFPVKNYKYVLHGFDGWLTWNYVFKYKGSYSALTKDYFLLVDIFLLNKDIEAESAYDLTTKKMDGWAQSGFKIVSNMFWNGQDLAALASSFGTLTSEQTAKMYVDKMAVEYEQKGEVFKTPIGNFIEISK